MSTVVTEECHLLSATSAELHATRKAVETFNQRLTDFNNNSDANDVAIKRFNVRASFVMFVLVVLVFSVLAGMFWSVYANTEAYRAAFVETQCLVLSNVTAATFANRTPMYTVVTELTVNSGVGQTVETYSYVLPSSAHRTPGTFYQCFYDTGIPLPQVAVMWTYPAAAGTEFGFAVTFVVMAMLAMAGAAITLVEFCATRK